MARGLKQDTLINTLPVLDVRLLCDLHDIVDLEP